MEITSHSTRSPSRRCPSSPKMLAFSFLSPALPTRLSAARPALSSRRGPCMVLDPASFHAAASALLDPTALSATAAYLAADLHHAAALPFDAAHSVAVLLSDAAAATAPAVDAVVEAKKAGWWNSFVGLVESAVVSLHGALAGAGIPGAYGLSIILFTLGIKLLTFPLNYKQMESTMRMQALSPRLKKLQTDYKDNPSVQQQMIAQLYKDEKVNPLAGCLPVFAQIPVWIALYRSVLNLAADNLLAEPFLWLPSLQGPVSKTGQGLSTWLYPLVDGAPPIGWHDALCYMILPVVLVATQFYSQRLMQPPTDDPQQKQATSFLKFMPLLIGWFSLNVPSGLGVYWVTNNILSTAQTVYIRNQFPELTKQSTAPVEEDEAEEVGASALDVADGFRKDEGVKGGKANKAKKRRKRR